MSSYISRAMVRAPSNIAIIKYMGKVDASVNLPANPSLSMTLQDLCSVTEATLLETHAASGFGVEWEGAAQLGGFDRLRPMAASSPSEQAKLSYHVERVVRALRPEFSGSRWRIRSGNAFPAGAGIASSASGFAALTLAVAEALGRAREPGPMGLPELSRQGSGSSCRSFEGPWVLWEKTQSRKIDSNLEPLADLVLVVDEAPKLVGSSEAHTRVLGSPQWRGRTERASQRLAQVIHALSEGDFATLSRLAFEEALDMHGLFHTSVPPFSYQTEQTRRILGWIEVRLRGRDDFAPTLDAGPNVHLLVPRSRAASLRAELAAEFPQISILQDVQGLGAAVLSSEGVG